MTVILAEYQQNFNSQPHKEADKNRITWWSQKHHFNSQPHKEADEGGKRSSMVGIFYFNSQPHKEADKLDTMISDGSFLFQLTASQGG